MKNSLGPPVNFKVGERTGLNQCFFVHRDATVLRQDGHFGHTFVADDVSIKRRRRRGRKNVLREVCSSAARRDGVGGEVAGALGRGTSPSGDTKDAKKLTAPMRLLSTSSRPTNLFHSLLKRA